MRKIVFILFGFMLPFFLQSCDDEEQILPREDFFVAFQSTSGTIQKNAATPASIPVYVAAERGDAVSVTIGVNAENSTAIEGTDFEFVHGPELNFPIGAGYDTLRIQPIPGGTQGNLVLELFLQSNSAGYKMGFFYGEEADSTSHDRFLLTIIE